MSVPEALLRLVAAEDWARDPVSLLPAVEAEVRAIVADVAQRGDAALAEHTWRLDRVRPTQWRVPSESLLDAWERAEPAWQRALQGAADNIRRYHECQKQSTWYVDDGDGVRLGQRIMPLQRAGLYVPGGTAAYSSSVLMTVIPAQIAGVEEIHLVSPPQQSGWPHSDVMAAAHALGLTHVWAIGGAQAIAALAYGTDTIPKVDKVVGPGNAFVTAAKKQVYGLVDIDSLAGPSEVVVLADSSASPHFVAHDLLAQAEHDAMASATLVTTSHPLATAVEQSLRKLTESLPRAQIAAEALRNHGSCVVTSSLNEAVALVNRIAPEHLELMVENPWEVLEQIEHAGAVFVGPWSAVAVGDYYAGPNHVLPTGGAARFASALGVEDFIRRQSVIAYSRERLGQAASAIATLARSEGLEAHARSVEARAQ